MKNIYKNLQPHEIPAYSPSEVAKYLQIPVSTINSWIKGRPYPTLTGDKFFYPLIIPADMKSHELSFQNMIEIFVLNSLRKTYEVPIPNVRTAIQTLRKHFKNNHPLSEYELLTDKRDIFIEEFGKLLNVSRDKQLEMKSIIKTCIQKVGRDENNRIIKFYPHSASKKIEIDPSVRFGRPVISNKGVPTDIIYERYLSGETKEFLSFDFDCDKSEIDEAIKYEESISKRAA
jgi:uncharacterized protein (DUF433 family)